MLLEAMLAGLTGLAVLWLVLQPIVAPSPDEAPIFDPPEAEETARGRALLALNPFTHLVRSYRNCLLEGAAPDWPGLAYFTLCALVTFLLGYWWVARTRKNFADVI